MKKKVCIFSTHPLGEQMNGMAIRFYEMGKVLEAAGYQVTHLVETCSPSARRKPDFTHKLEKAVKTNDIFILQPDLLYFYYEWLWYKILIVDLICPFHIEHMQQGLQNGRDSRLLSSEVNFLTRIFNVSIQMGDFLICGSEAQQQYYQGYLHALGCSSLGSVEDVQQIPFGIPDHPPDKNKSIKGKIRGIRARDTVFLWWGGLWGWYDPLPMLKGFRSFNQRRSDSRLVFPAGNAPGLAEAPVYKQAYEFARDKKMLGRSVFFLEDWVPYAERGAILSDVDVAVTSFDVTMETKLSCRARYADYVWSGLPMILSQGESFSEKAVQQGWGLQVKTQSSKAWQEAFVKMGRKDFRSTCRKNLEKDRPQWTWTQLCEPLLTYLKKPVKRCNPHLTTHFKGHKNVDTTRTLTLFGASRAGLRVVLLSQLRGYKVRCFYDSQKKLHGKTIEGIPIRSPEEIKKDSRESIIITSFPGREEIAAMLENKGLIEGKDFFWFGDADLRA